MSKEIKALLNQVNLPSKQIECYGSQVVITCQSERAANDWAAFLASFCKIKKVLMSFDPDKYGRDRIKVWRAFATLTGESNQPIVGL